MTRGFKRRSSSIGSACEGYNEKPSQQQLRSIMATREDDLDNARKLLSSLLYIKDSSGRSYLHTDFRLRWAKALLDRARYLDQDAEEFLAVGANAMEQYHLSGKGRKFSNSHTNDSLSVKCDGSTLMQRRFLLQSDQESGYTPFHRAILEGNLAAILLFLRHVTADESDERLTQRPMTLLYSAEANAGQSHASKTKRLNNPLLVAMANAIDKEGLTPLRLLGRLQRKELFHCRRHLESFRLHVDRNATMRLRTRQRRSSFDDSAAPIGEVDNNIDFFSENADLLGEGSQDEENRLDANNDVSYACEVVTFGRPHHCALGVVQGLGQSSSAFNSLSREGNGNQKFSHGSGFSPQRVQEFAQEIVGRSGSAMAIAAATHHTLVVTKKGHLYAFGLEKGGRLGLGDNQAKQCPLPKRVLGPLQRHKVISIAAAENHSLCVTSRGDVYAWGSNRFGQLGDHSAGGTATTPCGSRSFPRRVDDLKHHPCVAVAAGEKHSVALSRKGEVYVWGDNTSGQLGVPRRSGIQKVQRVEALWGASLTRGSDTNRPITTIAIAAAEQSTLVLTTGSPTSRLNNVNAIYEWGHGNHVPIKIHFDTSNSGTSNRQSSLTSNFRRTPNPTAIACARYHNAAITSDGLVYTWGLRAESLGRGNNDSKSPKQHHPRRNSCPQLVTGMLSENGGGFAVVIAASGSHTAVVCDDGALFTWGTTDGNNVYNLGHEGVRWQPNPKRVPGVHRAVDVAVAKEHTVLLVGTSFPSFPSRKNSMNLEALASRKVSEYVDLFNVIPILVLAERTKSSLLTDYCVNFVRRNLDGVLNVGKKSAMNQYLNDVLTETLYHPEIQYRDDHHHPIVLDVLAAGNGGRSMINQDWFSEPKSWIEGCKLLTESTVVQRILEVASVCEYEEDIKGLNSKARRGSSCHQDYSDRRDRKPSLSESGSATIQKAGTIDEAIRRTANMNLATLELANENSVWLSKEIRGIRKKLKQIQNLVDTEIRQEVLTPEQKAKVARRPTLETELSIFESALEEVDKRIKEFERGKQDKEKPKTMISLNESSPEICERVENKVAPLCSEITNNKDNGMCAPSIQKKQVHFCEICGTKCSDISNFILHQNGRKHRNRVAKMLEEEKKKVAASIQQQQQLETMMKSVQVVSPSPKKKIQNAWGAAGAQPKYKLPPPPHAILAQVPLSPSETSFAGAQAVMSTESVQSLTLHQTKKQEQNNIACRDNFNTLQTETASASGKIVPKAPDFAKILPPQSKVSVSRNKSPKHLVWGTPRSPSYQNAMVTDDINFRTSERKQSVSLADFLTPRKKAPSTSPVVAPWMAKTNGVTMKTPPNTKTIAQIQAEEETLKSRQDKSYGTGGGSWYIERRERAESVLEIQRSALEDLEHRRLVEEQLEIEAQIRAENDRKQQAVDRGQVSGKHTTPNRRNKKKKQKNAPRNESKEMTSPNGQKRTKKKTKTKNNTSMEAARGRVAKMTTPTS